MAGKKYTYQAIKKLCRQLLLSPPKVRLAELERAEELIGDIARTERYPYDFVYERITGYESSQSPSSLMTGQPLLQDLTLLCEELSESLDLRAEAQSERVYTLDDLVEMFDVSLHTITCWRRLGLVSRKLLFDGGRRRVAFLQSRLDAFIPHLGSNGATKTDLRPLLDKEKKSIVSSARRTAKNPSLSFRDIVRRVANRFDRSSQTVRYVLVRHAAMRDDVIRQRLSAGQLSAQEKRRIYELMEEGKSVHQLARVYACRHATIYRAYYQVAAEEILAWHVDYVRNELFEHPRADKVILAAPMPESGRRVSKASRHRTAAGANLAAITSDPQGQEPLLSRELEQDLFRRYNYLKYKVAKLRKELSPSRAKAGIVLRIRKTWGQAVAIKQRIVRANLGLVISIARRHVGTRSDLSKLIGDGNYSLMLAVEKFDFSRGFRFSTYASWAIMKNFAKSIPEESYQLENYVTGTQEIMEATGASRNLGTTKEERLPLLRNELGKFVNKLPDRERVILINRFGLFDATAPRTLEQIGKIFSLSKERIRQIEERALGRLRKIMSREKMEALLEE